MLRVNQSSIIYAVGRSNLYYYPCLSNGARSLSIKRLHHSCNYDFPAKWARCQLAPSFVFRKDFLSGAMVIVNDGHGIVSSSYLYLLGANMVAVILLHRHPRTTQTHLPS